MQKKEKKEILSAAAQFIWQVDSTIKKGQNISILALFFNSRQICIGVYE